MKKVFLLTLALSVIFSTKAFAYDLNLKFDSYGSYEDDINKDGVKEKVWIVPEGGSYKVDKANSSVDMNDFTLHYDCIEVLQEPEYINGHPIYSYSINVGTLRGLEWYGALDTHLGDGSYAGPDTEYYFDIQTIIYVDTGADSGNLSYGDFANGIFSGKYPMTDPIPKDFYCITATKPMKGDALKTWYFKVLPYEYAAPSSVNAEVFGKDLTFNTYNIKGYNYFKIRDLAAALKDTDYAFNAQMDTLGLKMHMGGECSDTISNDSLGSEYAHAVHSNGGVINIDDTVYKSVECYNINGYNYYKIRDIADLLGFNINFDSSSGKIVCQ